MSKSYSTGSKFSSPDERVIRERIAAVLRELYPTKTAENVAADTGLPVYSIAKWLSGSSLPNCIATLTLFTAYPLPMLAALLPEPPACIVEAKRNEDLDALTERSAQLQRQIEALT